MISFGLASSSSTSDSLEEAVFQLHLRGNNLIELETSLSQQDSVSFEKIVAKLRSSVSLQPRTIEISQISVKNLKDVGRC
jgi:hypothetical protein